MSTPQKVIKGKVALGWSGYSCQNCNSFVLVGVVPSGWNSIAIPRCPATDSEHYVCSGITQQIPNNTLSDLLKTLAKDILDDEGGISATAS